MDFIERWFGVSPDGGSGSLELALTIGASVVLTATFLSLKFRKRRIPKIRTHIEPSGFTRI